MATPGPTSIHDADARSPRRARSRSPWGSPLVWLVAAGVLLLAGAWWVLGSPGSTDAESSDLAANPTEAASTYVLIDGWSERTLGGAKLRATVGGSAASLRLEPVTSADLDELLATTPEVIQSTLARLITSDPTLTCDSQGCRTGDGPVDPHILLLRGNSTAEQLLHGHQIRSGLFKAHVPVEPGELFTVGADGFTAVSLVGHDETTQSPRDGDARVEPTAGNGFGQGRWLVAAGLGRVFLPTPTWLGQDEGRVAWGRGTAGDAPAGVQQVLYGRSPVTVAVRGLGYPTDVAQDWSPSQLTLATSPSQGCAAGVLCYPGRVPTREVMRDPVAAQVQSGAVTAGVWMDDRVVTVPLDAPIRQAGIDELLDGDTTLRFVTVTLFTGPDLVATDWAGLVEVQDDGQYSLADALSQVRLAGDRWEVTP